MRKNSCQTVHPIKIKAPYMGRKVLVLEAKSVGDINNDKRLANPMQYTTASITVFLLFSNTK
jgi:hypothetical protein